MIDAILRLIDKGAPISFFLGAGFSLGKWNNQTHRREGLGTGEELAEYLISKNSLLKDTGSKNLMNISDEYSFHNDSEFRDELQRYLGEGIVQSSHNLMSEVIYDLGEPKDFILSVNVDDLLEQAFRDKYGKLLSVAKRPEDIYTGGDKVYLKLHGCVTEIGKAVFTTKDYLTIEDNNSLFEKLKTIFAERSIIFIGFGMADIDVLRMLYRVRPQNGFTKPHYWIVPKSKGWSVDRERYYLREFNINHIDMTAEDFLQVVNDHLKKKEIGKY
ncbi:SIR2 family protein [Paenibacillus macerans]|uniref:SIR2 family NAD-dependent protein deacylase n=1 Tax=Paenibacillus macerans TaxID=44252 RepID=UPI002DB6CCC9|nr:SIR2 family protein [Paenibacillus macerans]MEC0329600.1 SIR2 family protein [Paenibacillus macerans]